jgi:hypothetical protein
MPTVVRATLHQVRFSGILGGVGLSFPPDAKRARTAETLRAETREEALAATRYTTRAARRRLRIVEFRVAQDRDRERVLAQARPEGPSDRLDFRG